MVERGRWLPSVNEVDGDEEGSEIVWKFPERMLWLRDLRMTWRHDL